MANLNLKQVGDDIRQRLSRAKATGYLPSRNPDDHYGSVRYDVRVSNGKKSGPKVNIEINGYDWLIPDKTDADSRRRWNETEGKALLAKVDEVAARQRFTSADGAPAIGGETKFGVLLISARVTGYTHIAADGTEASYVYCDRCRAAIPKHGVQRYSLASAAGIEELCKSCHDADWEAELNKARDSAQTVPQAPRVLLPLPDQSVLSVPMDPPVLARSRRSPWFPSGTRLPHPGARTHASR
jgi:hypothetical protein